jgi:hypothetical protein
MPNGELSTVFGERHTDLANFDQIFAFIFVGETKRQFFCLAKKVW